MVDSFSWMARQAIDVAASEKPKRIYVKGAPVRVQNGMKRVPAKCEARHAAILEIIRCVGPSTISGIYTEFSKLEPCCTRPALNTVITKMFKRGILKRSKPAHLNYFYFSPDQIFVPPAPPVKQPGGLSYWEFTHGTRADLMANHILANGPSFSSELAALIFPEIKNPIKRSHKFRQLCRSKAMKKRFTSEPTKFGGATFLTWVLR